MENQEEKFEIINGGSSNIKKPSEEQSEFFESQEKRIGKLETENENLREESKKLSNLVTMGFLVVALTVLISMVGIIKDVGLDVSRYDILNNSNSVMWGELAKQNQNLFEFQKENLEKQIILDCLKLKDKKYWEYSECFK